MKDNTFEVVAKQYCTLILDFIKIIKEDYLYLRDMILFFEFKNIDLFFRYPDNYAIDFKQLLNTEETNPTKLLYNDIMEFVEHYINNNSQLKDSIYVIKTLPIKYIRLYINYKDFQYELIYYYKIYSDYEIPVVQIYYPNTTIWIKNNTSNLEHNYKYESDISLQKSFNTFLYLIKLYQSN